MILSGGVIRRVSRASCGTPRRAGMRFAQTADEVIQFFENGRAWRDIWTDGRKLPGDDADSRWYGYAVGHWEGDTFVVNSNNFDEAQLARPIWLPAQRPDDCGGALPSRGPRPSGDDPEYH